MRKFFAKIAVAVALSAVISNGAAAVQSCEVYQPIVELASDYATWTLEEMERLSDLYRSQDTGNSIPGEHYHFDEGCPDIINSQETPLARLEAMPAFLGCTLFFGPTLKFNATDRLSDKLYAQAKSDLKQKNLCKNPNTKCPGVSGACTIYNSLFKELTQRTYAVSVKLLREHYAVYMNPENAQDELEVAESLDKLEQRFNMCSKSAKSKNLLVLMAVESACYHGLDLGAD